MPSTPFGQLLGRDERLRIAVSGDVEVFAQVARRFIVIPFGAPDFGQRLLRMAFQEPELPSRREVAEIAGEGIPGQSLRPVFLHALSRLVNVAEPFHGGIVLFLSFLDELPRFVAVVVESEGGDGLKAEQAEATGRFAQMKRELGQSRDMGTGHDRTLSNAPRHVNRPLSRSLTKRWKIGLAIRSVSCIFLPP